MWKHKCSMRQSKFYRWLGGHTSPSSFDTLILLLASLDFRSLSWVMLPKCHNIDPIANIREPTVYKRLCRFQPFSRKYKAPSAKKIRLPIIKSHAAASLKSIASETVINALSSKWFRKFLAQLQRNIQLLLSLFCTPLRDLFYVPAHACAWEEGRRKGFKWI